MDRSYVKNKRNVSIFATILIWFWMWSGVQAWDAEDFEVFDLVEEIGKNFYEVLGVAKDASQSELRKAYHRLSLQLHPDHNKLENAEQIFRQLVAVYEVLKDEAKREKYDRVLAVGLPDWRQPIFYYRRVRKVGLVELAGILFTILTVGQYIVAWSMYFERKYEIEEIIGSKLKKIDRKCKRGKATSEADDSVRSKIQEEICQLPKPRCRDLLPFLIVRGLVFSVLALPSLCSSLCSRYRDFVTRRREAAAEAAAAASDQSDDDELGGKATKSRRRRAYEIPEFRPDENPALKVTTTAASPEVDPDDDCRIVYENRIWFDDDIAALTRAMVKYPVGTGGRWDVIAQLLRRSRQDVIAMAKTVNKLSGAGSKPVSDSIQSSAFEVMEEEAEAETVDSEKPWSAAQQKALEVALLTFPKGVEDRWDRIGSSVPDRTKEDCILRYKYLVEVVKKRRQQNDVR